MNNVHATITATPKHNYVLVVREAVTFLIAADGATLAINLRGGFRERRAKAVSVKELQCHIFLAKIIHPS